MTEQQIVETTTTAANQEFTVRYTALGEDQAYQDNTYAHKRSARRRANKMFESGLYGTVEIVDNETGEVVFKLQSEEESMEQVNEYVEMLEAGATDEEMESLTQEAMVREQAEGNGNNDTGYPPENPESREAAKRDAVKATERWAAGEKRKKGEITQEQYDRVIDGEIRLDEAVAEFKAMPEEEKPEENPKKKRATANPDKKSKKRAKTEAKQKEGTKPREANPDNFYSAAGQIGYAGEVSEKNMNRKHNLAVGEKDGNSVLVHSVWISPNKLGETATAEGGPLESVSSTGKWNPEEKMVTMKGNPTEEQIALLKERYGVTDITIK